MLISQKNPTPSPHTTKDVKLIFKTIQLRVGELVPRFKRLSDFIHSKCLTRHSLCLRFLESLWLGPRQFPRKCFLGSRFTDKTHEGRVHTNKAFNRMLILRYQIFKFFYYAGCFPSRSIRGRKRSVVSCLFGKLSCNDVIFHTSIENGR